MTVLDGTAHADTRQQIVDAANRLFYEQGYEHTSFASIAAAVGISRGNFYYHFKAKDQILDAVIEARLRSTRETLAGWSADAETPLERIFRFVDIVVDNRDDIERYGCPVGTLSSELAKLQHPARPQAVGVFTLFRTWLHDRFAELGAGPESDDLALRVLAFSQGTATLANAFGDRAHVEREVDRLKQQLREQFPTP
jgi:TetR/AcrR family transcriptional regulator, transcriptional repressor for nem operon